jgi:hypothetical protein
MPIVCLILPHLCLIRLRLFCYSQTNAYALDGHLSVFSATRRLVLMASRPSSFPPSTPCAPEYSCYNTGGCHHQSYSYSPNRTHTMPAPRPSCPRSVPLHMSRWKSLIGCHVVVRAGENVTYAPHKRDIHRVHTGNVLKHHRHVTARHSHRLMLHYSPRFMLCWGDGIVPPCLYGSLP